MTPGAIAVLSLSMSTDAFAAAVGRGAAHRPSLAQALRAGMIFGMIEATTPVIGWGLGLIAAPTVILSTWLYSVWSTRGALMLMLGVSTLGLIGLALRGLGIPALADPLAPLALLIVGSCGVISIILPYTAENYPLRIRGRAPGWIAGCSKLGGLLAQGLGVAALAPSLSVAAALTAIPTAVALGLIALFGRETRGRDLRDLED